jgi:hypothetical protein
MIGVQTELFGEQSCMGLRSNEPTLHIIGYRLWIDYTENGTVHHVDAGCLQDNDYDKELVYKPLPIRHDIKRFADSMAWWDRFEPLGGQPSYNPRYKDPLIAKKRQQTALAILADALADDTCALALCKRFGEQQLKGREFVAISRCAVQEVCWRMESEAKGLVA